MDLKNINNLFLLIILSPFLISCSMKDLMNKENLNIDLVESDIIETTYFIEETSFNQKSELLDFYNRNNNFHWKESTKLKKIYDISFGNKLDKGLTNPSNLIISNNFAYYVDSETKFINFC